MDAEPADVVVELGVVMREVQYSDLSKEDLGQMQKDLLNGGTGLLFMGLFFTIGVAMILGIPGERPYSGYGYVLGGLLVLFLLLRNPINPVRLGHRAIPKPEEWSPYELALLQLIRQLRSRWLLITSSAVLLPIGLLYGGSTLASLTLLKQCITNGHTWGFAIFGFVHVGAIISGLDLLYVWWKLREESRFT